MGFEGDGSVFSPPGPLVMGRSTWLAALKVCCCVAGRYVSDNCVLQL